MQAASTGWHSPSRALGALPTSISHKRRRMMLSSRCNQSQPLPPDLLLQPQHEDSSTLDKSATRSAKIFFCFLERVTFKIGNVAWVFGGGVLVIVLVVTPGWMVGRTVKLVLVV